MRSPRRLNRQSRIVLDDPHDQPDDEAVEIVEAAETPAQEEFDPPVHAGCHRERGQAIVVNHMFAAMGLGMVPAPAADLIGGVSVQLNMIERLCALHELPYSRVQARAALYLLLQNFGLAWLLQMAGLSLMKASIGMGLWASVAGLPLVLGASTYAVGRVMAGHFESGGTLDDLEALSTGNRLRHHYRNGKRLARSMWRRRSATNSS